MSPVQVIERQLAAYNAHDIEGFCATYAEDVVIHNITSSEPVLAGKRALRERYSERFSNAELGASIEARVVSGDFVIDREVVSGLPGGETRVGVVYQVSEGLISRVWFLR